MRRVILFFLLCGLGANAEETASPKKDSAPPIEINAGSMIADQKESSVLLKGKVEAIQGDTHLWADEVWGVAPPGTQFGFKNPKIVEAKGKVIARIQNQTGSADTATYKTNDRHLHLEGKNVHLISKNQRLTSYESIDYWEDDLKAIARNNVILHVKDKIIKTDELVVFFKKNTDGRLELTHAYSPKRVSIATPEEVFIGDKGEYNASAGIVTLEGNVSVTRLSDQSRLSGAYATVNLNTGVSRVYATPPVTSQAKSVPIQGKLPAKEKKT
ncbi:MAG: hypothetical protein LBD15_04070 [Holosporales bacterium]|jgi:lipopolysaccharide transport protein LptA|nr:hypothetical protein [Holosporales bacterium]